MRPLAPKPPALRREDTITPHQSRSRKYGVCACNVPICPHKTCMLRSHQQYGAPLLQQGTIERPIYDEALVLGLEDAFERDLFQHCLSNMLEKKMLVYGPAFPMTYDIAQMRNTIVGAAIASEHSTLVVVSMAYCDVFRRRPAPPEQLDRMYDKLKVALRNETDIEKVLMFVIAQSIIDRHRGRDVQPHRKVLGEIAKDRIHTLHNSLYYVIEADRRLAVWTNSVSALHVTDATMSGFQYLREARELIKAFESEGRVSDESPFIPISPYQYYKRDELSNAFTRIHALSEGKEWCAAVAARIIEFQITFEGELESCMSLMIACLVEGLRSKLQKVDWSEDKEMLIWILFIVGDAWTIRRLLEDVHGSRLPTCQQQWDTVTTRFVWADRMHPKFSDTFEAVIQCIVRSDGPG